MDKIKIAYFSAEIGILEEIKTYSGGLGILAGETIKAMADLEIPFCAVTLLYKKGYFKQKIIDNIQTELDDDWEYWKYLSDTGKRARVNISGSDIFIKIWRYDYTGITGKKVPIFFLDTKLDENPEWARTLTDYLYVGDRLSQEIVLGIGGIRALCELGVHPLKYHMNEGHSVFLTLELYKKIGETIGWDDWQVKQKCVFTTHTPIPAGHDIFTYDEFYEKLKGETNIIPLHIKRLAGSDVFNTTKLALSFSGYHNAVSRKHMEITKQMFPDFTIDYITNGVNAGFWASDYMQEVFNKHIKDWKLDFTKLSQIKEVDGTEILNAHKKAKQELIEFVNATNIISDVKLKEDILTIGFARRFVAYKDAELIFNNLDNLKELGKKVQFIFAGKAHKKDGLGKDIMNRIIENAQSLKEDISIAFLENYNIDIAKKMVGGCDLWLNTPIPFNEASGTSGMKASVNGCLHFSRLDGWAIEGFERNGGGFPICDYNDFISILNYKIIPMFYEEGQTTWSREMKLAIGNSASYFNTHRMAKEYIKKAYKISL